MKERHAGNQPAHRSAWTFLQPVQPDETLSEITGHDPLPRSELIKRLWDYIREHGLQDTQHKAIINADDKLKPLFGGKSRVTVLEMTRLVSAHVSQ